jgi:glycosidase
MQLFGRGLRRRLPPMLDGDSQRMRLVYSLLLSLPGTPVLFYGEEIGMGEHLGVDGRLAVRTPMQWTDDASAGFSTARPGRLVRPVTPGRFGPMAVNVADQRRDPESLLNWMERMIRRRKETPELGWGAIELLDVANDAVLAHRTTWDGRTVLLLHNLSPEPCSLRVPLPAGASTADDLLDDAIGAQPVASGVLELKLEGYGYRWFRLQRDDRRPTP